jgi:WD40 repeat protein
MPHIFISYSRKDIDFAGKIVKALADSNLDTWIDWKSIPGGEDWEQEIYRGIEESDVFLFLLSPDSVASEMCNKEIACAVENGKRIIPVFISNVDVGEVNKLFRQENSREEISRRNYVFCRFGQDDFNKAIEKIQTTIRTDYEWLKTHTKLQVDALMWERNGRESSFLLRGNELQNIDNSVIANSGTDPSLTPLQLQFIQASKENEGQLQKGRERLRRNITIGLSLGLTLTILLSLFAWGQRNSAIVESDARATAQIIAEHEAKVARVGELAAQSVSLRDKDFSLSLLLGLEAFHVMDTVQSRSVLLDNTMAHPQLETYLRKHSGLVSSIMFSPDGNILASGSNDGNIILWDMKTRQPTSPILTGNSGFIHSIAFSPDGKILASGNDNGIALWDVKTRQLMDEPIPTTAYATKVAFSPDGTILAFDEGNAVVLWDRKSHQIIGQPMRGLGPLTSFAFSHDGALLAVGSSDILIDNIGHGLLLYDVKTQEQIGEPLTGFSSSVEDVAFSPDGNILASGHLDGTIIFWDVKTHQPTGQPLLEKSFIRSIAFSPDGNTLASGYNNGNIVLWDTRSRQAIGQPYIGHTSYVASIVFNSDGTSLASSSNDGTIILWGVNNQPPISKQLIGNSASIEAITFSPDGNIVASGGCRKIVRAGCTEGEIVFWDTNSRQPIGQPLAGLSSFAKTIAFSPDGKILAFGIWDAYLINWNSPIFLWDVKTYQPIGEPLIGHTANVESIAFSPSGKILASGSSDGTIILWDLETHHPIGQPLMGKAGYVFSLAFSSNGSILASGYYDGTVVLWDVITRQSIDKPFKANSIVNGVAISPDGKILAVASDSVDFWDLESDRLISRSLIAARSIVFSSDGNTLASAGPDGIILWDTKEYQPIGQPFMSDVYISSIAFNTNGKILASSHDGTITLWSVVAQSWVETTCKRVGRNFTRAEWTQYFPSETYRITCLQWPAGD